MIVREAKKADAKIIHRIHERSLPSPWSLDSIRDWLGEPSWLWLVAVKDEKIVGFLSSRFLGDTVELLNIAVLEDARRFGAGQALIDELIARVSSEPEVEQIVLEVRYGNEAARALYVKSGFRLVRAEAGYYRDTGEAMWQMARQCGHSA